MKIFMRMLKLATPYWKMLILAILTSLIYVALNSGSIWLTASFVKVIFPEENTQQLFPQELTPEKESAQLNLNTKMKHWTRNLIRSDNKFDTLKKLCIAIFLAFLLKNIFLYLKGISFAYVQLHAITDLRNKLYQHLHHLSLSFYHRKRSGEISSIMIYDISNMRNTYSISFNKLLVEPINIIAFVVLLFIISWQLTLMAIVILPLSGYLIRVIGQSIRRKSIRTSRKMAGIMSIMNETISGIRIVKAFAMEKFEIRRFIEETKKYYRLLFRRKRLNELSTPLNEIFAVLIGVVLLYIGGRHALSGTGLESEDFIRYVFLIFALLDPIKKLNKVNVNIQTGIASGSRVFSIMDEKSDVVDQPGARPITDFNDCITYKNVYFQYESSDDNVLSNINLEIRKGEVVAIVGPSGAGKSTLADLLPRFYDPTHGRIKIDGTDIRSYTLKSLRSLMGIVTQETILFNDTILNNIAYGSDEVDIQKVRQVAKAANALEFIDEMSAGFETEIGDKGARLSGGQRQRVAIARALLKNPPILILDEATSSLDSESEQKVQKAIELLMQDRTAIVIAHRLSTIQNADKIVLLDNGKIEETGTHTELLEKGGKYKYLYDTQQLISEEEAGDTTAQER